MKKLYHSIAILLTFFNVSFGQIYAVSGVNQSITITPQGVNSNFPISTEVTNVALGRGALSSVTIGTQNTAVGDKALFNNTTSQNSAFGNFALFTNTTGTLNSAFGANALEKNTSGSENAALGSYALNNNTSLSKNVAVGYYALFGQSYNGNNSSENTAIGHLSLATNNPTDATNGRKNTSAGAGSLYFNETGGRNSALGYGAMYAHETGDDNVVIGYYALKKNSFGSKNVAIGSEALLNSLGSGNVAIGYRAGYNVLAGDDKLYIANSETSAPLIGGDFGAKKVSIGRSLTTFGVNDFLARTETLQVEGEAFKTSGTGNWKFGSDRRLKKNIVSLNSHEMLAKLLQMQGVTYEMQDENQKGIHHGFIAQDLLKIFPTKIKENAAGYLSSDYGSYDAILVEAIKALNENIESLEENIPNQEAKYAQASLKIDALTEQISFFELKKNK